jgi:hypothetical protein
MPAKKIAPMVHQQLAPTRYRFNSEHDSDITYMVEWNTDQREWTCIREPDGAKCPALEWGHGYACKHITYVIELVKILYGDWATFLKEQDNAS